MTLQSRADNRQAWIDRIQRFEQAGQTVAQFCLAEGISQVSFYQWRRKLRPAADDAPSKVARFVPVSLPQDNLPSPTAVMSVELPGGIRVRLEVTSSETPRS